GVVWGNSGEEIAEWLTIENQQNRSNFVTLHNGQERPGRGEISANQTDVNNARGSYLLDPY
ncbi:hypothetical protein ACAG75_16970, partial [Klebsiella pneumoniae]|uniref:hypothetical protein n=1 Tax=Klebsiella pneumoniae TaxID=573 RepID=UPI00385FAF94